MTRRELLTVAAGTLLGACADVTAAGPDAGDVGDDVGPDAGDAGDDAGPDAAPDAAPLDTAPPDVAPDRPRDGASTPDAPLDARADLAPDAPPDARPDAAPDARPDAAPDASLDAAPDAPPPCGLTDRYLASLPVASVPARGGVVDPDLRVVVARDARGVYAFSAVCPHFGCVVEVGTGASTVCPCHGSTFDDDGTRLRGPATRSLINHPIALCLGRVYVDRSRSVPAGTRTPG
ncbi:MAG: Rieske 2Fe-2S domain-containing protein [Polyangiales bacterium]